MRVEMADLPAEIVPRGGGFLLTSVQDSRPHAAHLGFEVAIAPVDGGAEGSAQVELRAKVGRTSYGNCRMRPSVTVLWPSAEDGGYSLIVDGEARTDGDEHIVVTVTSAVLHRPA